MKSKIVRYKPTTPARRGASVIRLGKKTKPRKKLLGETLKKSGRDSRGRISVRRRGGGHKRKYRKIDFKRTKFDQKAQVKRIEYDPNRSANILLVKYEDGTYSYILGYKGAQLDHEVVSGEKVPIKSGNRTKLKNIPLGTEVYNVETNPGAGGVLFRSAGSRGAIEAKEGKYVNIITPSKETRRVLGESFASIGSVGNADHARQKIGKAGRKRHMGMRPKVRGVAMHPGAHPHGGGEGKTGIGLKHPKTFTGKIARGVKTRKKKKYSDGLIIKGRKR